MKPIFIGQENSDYTTKLSWSSEENKIINVLRLADGFLQSATVLSKQSMEDENLQTKDVLIFPILANAHHGIELYLKVINWMLNKILKNGNDFESGLDIMKLYLSISSKLNEFESKDDLNSFTAKTENLRSYIEELYPKIKTTLEQHIKEYSRYPFVLNFENFFYHYFPGNVEIDLENFNTRFEEIHLSLKYIAEDYLNKTLR